MTNFDDLLQVQLQDPGFRKEYDELEPEFVAAERAMFVFHKAASVETLPCCCLRVVFQDGVVKTYDIKKLFDDLPQLRALEEDTLLFAAARVSPGGYGIIWNEDLDLDCNEIYVNGDYAV